MEDAELIEASFAAKVWNAPLICPLSAPQIPTASSANKVLQLLFESLQGVGRKPVSLASKKNPINLVWDTWSESKVDPSQLKVPVISESLATRIFKVAETLDSDNETPDTHDILSFDHKCTPWGRACLETI